MGRTIILLIMLCLSFNAMSQEREVKGTPSPTVDTMENPYYGNRVGLDGDVNYRLSGRKALYKQKVIQKCNEKGKVTVFVKVDRQGKVVEAIPGVQGTTNNADCLLLSAKKAAMATQFDTNLNAPELQEGKIMYQFVLPR